jgi:hypothetical protein
VTGFHVWATTALGRQANRGGDGEVELGGLTAGDWNLRVEAPGFESVTRTATLAPGCEPLLFVLSEKGSVVDAAGRAVQGAAVFVVGRWDNEQASTEEQGQFEVRVSPGEVALRPRLPDGLISDAARVRVERRGERRGRSCARAGLPSRGASARRRGASGERGPCPDRTCFQRTLRVGPDGLYRFDALMPGEWSVGLAKVEMDPSWSTSSMFETPAIFEPNCTVRAGRVTRVDLERTP